MKIYNLVSANNFKYALSIINKIIKIQFVIPMLGPTCLKSYNHKKKHRKRYTILKAFVYTNQLIQLSYIYTLDQ